MKCKQIDCNEPRMVSAKGVLQTYCEEHQREYWRETARAKRPKNPSPQMTDSVGDNGTAIEAAHAETVAKTSRLSEADKQRLIDESRARVQERKTNSSTRQLDALNEGRITIDELDAVLLKLPRTFEERIPASEVAAPGPTEVDRRFKDTYTVEDIQKISENLGIQPMPFKPTVVHTDSAADECASGCNGCFYRDAVELLEKRVPGVREMVDGLKTIQRGRKPA